MQEKITIQNINQDIVNQIRPIVEGLKASEEEVKELVIEINAATGDIKLAWDLIREIHSSNVDLITSSRGNISAAGMILAAAGKPGYRFAELGTTFILNGLDPKQGKFKKVENTDAGVLEFILDKFQVRKRVMKEMLGTRNVISSVDAYTAKIIDKVDDFTSKYEKEKPKKEVVTTEEVSEAAAS